MSLGTLDVFDPTQQQAAAANRPMETATHLSHLVQHLYIGAAPLLFPLIMQDLGLSFMMISIIISVRTFCAGFFQVFYTHLARVFERRTIMNASNALSAVSSFGMGAVPLFAPFLGFNILWGLSTAPIHPIGGALLADAGSQTRRAGRAFNIGLFYSYAYVGNLIGALIATLFVSRIGWQGVFIVMGLLTLPVLAYGLVIGDRGAAAPRERKPASALLKAALADRKVILACLVGLLFFGGTNVFVRHLIPLYLTSEFKLSIGEASFVFILVSVIGIFSPPLFTWISARTDRKAVLGALALALTAAFVLLSRASGYSHAVLAALVLIAFLAWPLLALLQSFLVDVLEPEVKGAGGDLLLSVNICSFILWGSVFGFMVDATGSFRSALLLIGGLCLVSMPLLALIGSRPAGRAA